MAQKRYPTVGRPRVARSTCPRCGDLKTHKQWHDSACRKGTCRGAQAQILNNGRPRAEK